MKVHIVLERGYEYNDSTYDATEGGNAIHGYSNIEDAQLEVNRLSLIFARDGNLEKLHSEYEIFERSYNEDLNQIFKKYSIDYDDIESWDEFDKLLNIMPTMTNEEILLIMNQLVNKPYYIQSCDFNE